LTVACLIAPIVTTIFIILNSNKIQKEDMLVPANPGPPGKMAIKTGREYSEDKMLGMVAHPGSDRLPLANVTYC